MDTFPAGFNAASVKHKIIVNNDWLTKTRKIIYDSLNYRGYFEDNLVYDMKDDKFKTTIMKLVDELTELGFDVGLGKIKYEPNHNIIVCAIIWCMKKI